MTGISACLLCGGSDQEMHALRDAKDGKPLGVTSCRTCGMVQLAEVPTEEALSAFYATEYRKSYRGSAVPKARNVYKAGKKARDRLAPARALLPNGARHIDIGAGGGEMVFLSQHSGLQARGIDPNGEYVAFAQEHLQIDLTKAEINDLPTEPTYDLVTLFHVLEHLPHPREVMQRVAGMLNENGIFVIEVPNFGSAKLPPANTFFKAHITYFTEHSLRMLASEYFAVEQMKVDKVLYAVLRKRPAPQPQETGPRAASVALTATRFRQRGMGEYLVSGGLLSPFRRLAEALRTRRAIAGASPRAILEAIAR